MDVSQNKDKSSTHRGILRARWLKVIIGLAGLAGLLLVGLPYAMSYAAQQWLLANGVEQAAIEDIDFNPFTGILGIDQLQARIGDREPLLIPRFEVELDWLPLFSRQIRVSAVSVEGVHLEVEETAGGELRIGGVTLPEGGGESAPAEKPWHYGVVQLEIKDSNIEYRTPELQLSADIGNLMLGELTTWTTEPAPVVFVGALNGAAVKLDGQLPPLNTGYGYAGDLSVSGLPLNSFEKLMQPALAALDGRIGMEMRIEALQTLEGDLQVTQEGRVALDEIHAQQAENRFDYARLQWQGSLNLSRAATTPGIKLTANGNLGGEGLAAALPAESMELTQKQLEWQGEFTLSSAPATTGMTLTGKFLSGGLELLMPEQDMNLRKEQLEWDGEVRIATTEQGNRLNADGNLVIDRLDLQMPGENVAYQQAKLVWKGALTHATGDTADLQVDGALRVEKGALDSPGDDIELGTFDRLDVGSVKIGGLDAIVIDGLKLAGVGFAKDIATPEGGDKPEEEKAVLFASGISVNHVEVRDGSRVSIDTVEWRDVTSVERRNQDGEWEFIRLVDTLPFVGQDKSDQVPDAAPEVAPPAVPGASAAASMEPPGSVRVGVIRVTGDSTVIMDDRSVEPPFTLSYKVTEAELRDIDSARPDQDSQLILKGHLGDYTELSVAGTLRPLASPVALDLKGTVKGLELPPLSTYLATAIGHKVKSGQLASDSSLRIDKGQLDGSNKLTLRGLELEAVKGEQQEKMDSSISVPLDSALDLLRDKHNTIRLDLPISGDLESPDFDISDAINQAVATATKQAAKSFLILALQPYGSLITVAQLAGDAASRVRLDPLVFAAGSAVIEKDRTDYLDKVAGIIETRPNINIRLCGAAVAADRAALQEQAAAAAAARNKEKKPAAERPPAAPEISKAQLLKLADQRDAAVKDYFTRRHGINTSRLVACQPQFDEGQDAEPRVDLLL